jgi:hypothetical protein
VRLEATNSSATRVSSSARRRSRSVGSRCSHLYSQETLTPRIAQVSACGTRWKVLWSAMKRATLTSSPPSPTGPLIA